MEQINIKQVRQYFEEHYPQFIEEQGNSAFAEGNTFYTFARLADYLIEEGFNKNDEEFIHQLMKYVAYLYENGDDLVRNCLTVSFVEGLVDKAYLRKQGHYAKMILPYLPTHILDFIRSFFITEVLVMLELKIKINEVFKKNVYQLKTIYEEGEAKTMLWLLLTFYTGINKKDWGLNNEIEITTIQYQQIENAVKELLTYRPLQYILGEADFYGYKFKVNEATLIPRPETEELVFEVLKRNKQLSLKVLDIGTGTGCIPITLALETKKKGQNWEISALEISAEALKMAETNAQQYQVAIKWIESDILSMPTFPQKWDIIVSNPPYIPEAEKTDIAENVVGYEPHLALFVPDENPLLFYETIADFAREYLTEKGQLFFEIHALYGKETVAMLAQKGFQNIELQKDMQGKDRIVVAKLG